MNKLFLTFIPVLLVSAITYIPVAKAQDVTLMPNIEIKEKSNLTPFNLAYLAHQGYLKDQGIPDSLALMSGFKDGNITALQIVQAAVDSNRLPVAFLNNGSYIAALKNQLHNITLDR